MRAALIFSVGLFGLLGGCILSSEYDYAGYAETGGSSASSSGPGGPGPGGSGGAPPPVEVCGNAEDEDGDGLVCKSHLADWEGRFGDGEDQRVLSVALTASGAVVVAGEYNGTLNLGNGKSVPDTTPSLPTMPENLLQPFVAKLDPTGNPLWILNADDPVVSGDVPGRYTETVAYGEKVFVAGYIQSSTIPQQAVVAKADPAMDQSWKTKFGLLGGTTRAASIAVSQNGASVYVAGTVAGNGVFPCAGNSPSYDAMSQNRLFVAMLDASNGACAWAKVYDGGDFIFDTISIGIDPEGTLILGGSYTSGPTNTSWPTPTTGSTMGLFVAKATPENGTMIQSTGYTAAGGNLSVTSMAVDMTGNTGTIYMTGSFKGTFQTNLGSNGDPTSTADDTSTDAFVMAINPAGLEALWIDRFGGVGRQYGSSISAATGGVLVAGITDTPMAVDPTSEKGRICLDKAGCIFLMKLRENGRPEWAESFGPGVTNNSSVAIAAGDGKGGGVDLALGLSWEPNLSFKNPPELHMAGGGLDALVAKFSKIP